MEKKDDINIVDLHEQLIRRTDNISSINPNKSTV